MRVWKTCVYSWFALACELFASFVHLVQFALYHSDKPAPQASSGLHSAAQHQNNAYDLRYFRPRIFFNKSHY